MHHFGRICFSLRFGRHFLQNLADFGVHWGLFGDPLGALWPDFGDVFSGSDFRSIFGMLLGGVGRSAEAPVASESEESA